MLSAISGSDLVNFFVWLIVAGLIFFLLGWLIDYAKVAEQPSPQGRDRGRGRPCHHQRALGAHRESDCEDWVGLIPTAIDGGIGISVFVGFHR